MALNRFFSGAVLALFVVASVAAGEMPRIPTGDVLVQAKASVNTVYGEDIKHATNAEARATLARRMLKVAGDEKSPFVRYALLDQAKDLALDAGDAMVAYEIVETIVGGFASAEEKGGRKWIAEGDQLRQQARKEPSARAKLETRLRAAECYLRSNPSATGLEKEYVEKKISELALDGLGKKDADLRLLVGTWDVTASNGYAGKWTFSPDGKVSNGAGGNGKWIVEPARVKIVWGESCWETFNRPIKPTGVIGESCIKDKVIRAHRVISK